MSGRIVPDAGGAELLDVQRFDPVALVDAYVASLQSPRTRSTALESLRRIARLGGGAEPADVAGLFLRLAPDATWKALGVFRTHLAEAYPPATANLSLSHLRGLLRTAFLVGALTDRQYVLVRELRAVAGARVARGAALTVDQEQAFRAAARAIPGYRGAMLDAAIALSIACGLRREELCRLSTAALGDDQVQILGKGNRERHAVLEAGAIAAVERWLRWRERLHVDHDALFCSLGPPDRPLSTASYWQLLRGTAHVAFGHADRCDKTCRCRRVLTGPHDFRRTFATRLLEAGCDLGEVARLMGHASTATTERYDKRSEHVLIAKRRTIAVLTGGPLDDGPTDGDAGADRLAHPPRLDE